MGYAEKRRAPGGVTYYRARYKAPDGKYPAVCGDDGRPIRFPTRRTAEKAARDAERDVDTASARGEWVAPEAAKLTLREYVDGTESREGWLARQELAESTLQTYGHNLKHVIRAFGDTAIAEINREAIDAWERRLRADGSRSAAAYRGMLHLLLADAAEEGLVAKNAAARRRNRGRRAGRSAARGPEKKITSMTGALLLAERASLLTGRDDEFVASIVMAYTGMRWGEVVGLEEQYVRDQAIRVEQQLYELDSGEWLLGPPKDDSYRTILVPTWLTELVRTVRPANCPCHQLPFVFRGRSGTGGGAKPPVSLAEVARAAGVSAGTVSNVLHRPERVADETRKRVEGVITKLGYVRRPTVRGEAAHWRRSGYAAWVWTPAVSGRYPKRGERPEHPVPVTAEPWPGVPVRGRGASARATGEWEPIRTGLTRHGLRHTHRTMMEELGTPKVLMDERMGHTDSSVSARYAHVTELMQARLMEGLTSEWHASLDARLKLSPTSAVPVLERILREHEEASIKIVSQISPRSPEWPHAETVPA